MDQELFSLLDYVQQHSVISYTTSESDKGIVSSVNKMSEQQTIPKTVVDVSLPVANNFGESFQGLFSVDYAADNVPFYQDSTFVKPYNSNTLSYQTEYSESNNGSMQVEENPLIADHGSWLVNAEFPSSDYYSTYQVTECSSQDEYISCDFTQPLTGFPVNGSTKQHSQLQQEEPRPPTQFRNEEPTRKGESLITGFDKLQSTAVTPTVKPRKKQQDTELKPMVATDNASGAPKTRRKRRKLLLSPAVVSEWRCVPCNRMFRLERGLFQHNIYNHSGDKPYSCSICGKRYHDEQTALQHQKRHAVVDKPFKCEHCTKQYHHQYDLKRHIDLHHGVSRYNCKYCGKAFGRNDHVKLHETSHENGTIKLKRKHSED